MKVIKKQSPKAGGVVLSSVNKKGKIEITYNDGNEHEVIIGGTGSGKTQGLFIPSILSIADSGASMLINDPKGELYVKLSNYLRKKGYQVRMMDYAKPSAGSCFNQMDLINGYYRGKDTLDLEGNTVHEGGALSDLYYSTACGILLKHMNYTDPNFVAYADAERISLPGVGKKVSFIARDIKAKEQMSFSDFFNEYAKMLSVEASTIESDFKSTDIAKKMYKDNEFLHEKRRQFLRAMNEVMEDLRPMIFEGKVDPAVNFCDKRLEEIAKLLEISKNNNDEFPDIYRQKQRYYEDLKERVQSLGCSMEGVRLYVKEQQEYYYNKYSTLNEAASTNAQAIAEMIIESAQAPGSNRGDSFWIESPKALLSALILLTARECIHLDESHLGSVYRQMAIMTKTDDYGNTQLDKLLEGLLESDTARLNGAVAINAADKTKASIYASAISPCKLWGDPSVLSQSSETSFDLRECQAKPTAYFLNIPGKDQTSSSVYAVLDALFLEQFYTTLIEVARYSNENTLTRPVYYLMDEFTNTPHISCFGGKISLARSYKIRMVMCTQDLQQLETLYKDEYSTILANSNILYLMTNLTKTAEFISKRIGKKTIKVSNQSANSGKGKDPSTTSYGTSTQWKERDLMTPDELMNHREPDTGIFICTAQDACKVHLEPAWRWPVYNELKEMFVINPHQERPRKEVHCFCPDNIDQFLFAYNMFWKGYILDKAFYDRFTHLDSGIIYDATTTPSTMASSEADRRSKFARTESQISGK